MKKLIYALSAILLAAMALPVAASTSIFQLSGSASATFSLPTSPTPDASGLYNSATDPETYYFAVSNESSSTYNGSSADIPYIYFYTSPTGGLSFNVDGTTVFAESVYSNEQVFSGSVEAPTFTPGTYELQGAYDPSLTYTLAITEAVPEPATWLMMILGFGAVGVALRRKQGEYRESLSDLRLSNAV